MSSQPAVVSALKLAVQQLRAECMDDTAAYVDDAAAGIAELLAACGVLLGEWDRQDSGGKFDPMPGKDWAAAEARFRAAIANVTGGAP